MAKMAGASVWGTPEKVKKKSRPLIALQNI